METPDRTAAKKYDRSKVEEGDRRIVEGMLKHTRPVESAATTEREPFSCLHCGEFIGKEPHGHGICDQESCGLDFAHASHWWFDGDHDPENHYCPGDSA